MKKLPILALLIFCFSVHAQRQIPELWGIRVHDEAKVLSTPFIQRLEQTLKSHEDSTGNQIAVLIVPSLEGEVLEDYTLRVAEAWKLGSEKNDNGVLLFIAISDRKARIEVGEGLEGPLPDALCSQIIRNELAPYFRQDNYEAGVDATINAIIKAIAGEYHAEPQQVTKRRSRGSSFFTTIVFLIILFIILGRGRRGGGGMWSGRRGFGGGFFPPIGGFGGGGGGWSGGGGGGFSGGGGGFGGGGSSGSW